MIQLPKDFKEFLILLNQHQVEYLLVGGYAVALYGYVRATGDMDIWVSVNPDNADHIVAALQEFGFNPSLISHALFLQEGNVIRMGMPPMRIEVLTSISGVSFRECYDNRQTINISGVEVNVISLKFLKQNKLASGRHKDLDDIEHLPE